MKNGGIDSIRYPNFAHLGETSHVFANASTTSVGTMQALPALLTGTHQIQPAPIFSLYPNNLFTMLGDVYDIAAAEPLTQLCPPSVCNGITPPGVVKFITADDPITSGRHSSHRSMQSNGHIPQERVPASATIYQNMVSISSMLRDIVRIWSAFLLPNDDRTEGKRETGRRTVVFHSSAMRSRIGHFATRVYAERSNRGWPCRQFACMDSRDREE